MPACKTCGARMSSFSLGTEPASECRDCRKKREDAARVGLAPAAPSPSPAARTSHVPLVTFVIIGINVAVYLAMGLTGVSWEEPSSLDAIRWGADFGPLTLGGQWWRLFTSTFVHFGIVHIGLNMWCLYDLGRSLEYLMGRKAFTATYVATGIAASTVSLSWRPLSVSAGASGAIFGVAGAFAAYIFLKRIKAAPEAIKRTGKSLAIFIIYNLVRGAAAGGVDNAAHVGGLIAGLILGAIVPPVIHLRANGPSNAADSQLATPGLSPENTFEDEAHSNRIAWGIIIGSAIVLTVACMGVHSVHRGYAKYGEAVRLVQRGQLEQAAVAMQEGVENTPDLNFGYAYLGELELEREDPASAAAFLEKGMASGLTDLQTRQNLALAELGIEDFADAQNEIAPVFTSRDTLPDAKSDALYIRGIARGQTGNFSGAVSDLQAVAQAKPNLVAVQDALKQYQGLANQGTQAQNVPPPTIAYRQFVLLSEDWPLFP